MKKDIPRLVTQKILDRIKEGDIPWHKPFKTTGLATNLFTGDPYKGSNAFFLHPMVSGFSSNYWLGVGQGNKLGGRVKKGSKGTRGINISFWKKIDGKSVKCDRGGEGVRTNVSYFTVFNLEQFNDIEAPVDREAVVNVSAEDIIRAMKNPPAIGQKDYPCYVPAQDMVCMPPAGNFISDEEYYSTYFHELVHSTGHSSRLDRELKALSSDVHSYSEEELVAEIGAAFLCSMAGIECTKTLDNSVAYIQGWYLKLSDDPSILVKSAAKAEKAFRYIAGEKDVAECEEAKTTEAA